MNRPTNALSSLSATADRGLDFASPIRYRYPPPTTGFIAPTTTYELMRDIQNHAEVLDLLIQRYAADPTFRSSWNAWFERVWRPFYEKYAGPNSSEFAKLGAAFYSEQIAQQAERYRQELASFDATYRQQRQTNGAAVPAPSRNAPAFVAVTDLQGKPGGFGLPWWVWVLGGVAVVGVGYLGYQKAKELTAKRKAIEEHVLPKLIGADLARAAAARDPAHGREREPVKFEHDPFDLETYANRAPPEGRDATSSRDPYTDSFESTYDGGWR